jgi:hypothetical protein
LPTASLVSDNNTSDADDRSDSTSFSLANFRCITGLPELLGSSASVEELEGRLLRDLLFASTDSDGTSSRLRAHSAGLQRLQDAAGVLTSDVRADLSSVGSVLSRFAEFKQKYPEKYKNAYVSLSLPPLLGRLVEIDLLALPVLEEKVRSPGSCVG